MIEWIMFFAIGFLAASLLLLAFVPYVHNRAERLTLQRVDASIPLSIPEIHAHKDHLRAEFAIATRRFELRIEELTARLADQMAELGRKSALVNRLKLELDARTASMHSLRRRWMPFTGGSGDDLPLVKDDWLREAEHTLAEKDAEVAGLKAALDERSRTVDAERGEIVALKARIGALEQRAAELATHRAQERTEPEKRRAGLRLVR